MKKCVLNDNSGDSVIRIVDANSVTISNCTMNRNSGASNGSAVFVSGTLSLKISETVFNESNAINGAVIHSKHRQCCDF